MDRIDGDPPVVSSFFVFSDSSWSGTEALVFDIHANEVAGRLFKLKKTKLFRSQEHKLRIRRENKETGAEEVRDRYETGARQVRDRCGTSCAGHVRNM